MRSDMKKLLCERPRLHDNWTKPGPRHKNTSLEDLPSKQSMSRKRYGNKQLNEFLAPLKRFIHKQVGRRWNDVYSEIKKQITSSNPVDTHILEHIDGYINVKVRRVDVRESKTGLKTAGTLQPGRYDNQSAVRVGEIYVDPDDNIIKVAKNLVREAPKPAKPETLKIINRNQIAVKEDGLSRGLHR